MNTPLSDGREKPGESAQEIADSIRALLGILSARIDWSLWRAQDRNLEIASDLDLLCAPSVGLVLKSLRPELGAAGYRLLLRSHYDVAGSEALWFMTPAGSVVHLDFLADPTGLGRLGIPTAAAMSHRTPLHGLSWVGETWELAYRITKCVEKGATSDLERMGRSGLPVGAGDALATIFGRQGGATVQLALSTSMTASEWGRLTPELRRARRKARLRRNGLVAIVWAKARRVWERLRRPAGLWVHMTDLGKVADIEVLSGITAGRPRTLRGGPKDALSVIGLTAATFRPRLVVTASPRFKFPRWIPVQPVGDVASIVAILESRAWAQLR